MTKNNYILLILSATVLVFGVRLELIELFAVQTPYWDDWGIGGYVTRAHVDGLEFSSLFRNANEHRMTFNRLWSLALFSMNQEQWDPIVWMLSNAVIWSITGAILIAIVQKNAPANSRVLLTIFIVILWSIPFAMVNILWGIQTHTYTMILFSILGCWWISDQVLSLKWFLGILCLTAATLTLAGGTFASIAVIGVSFISLIAARRSNELRTYIITIIGAAIPAAVGLGLIASLGSRGVHEFILADSVTTFLKTMSWPDVHNIYHAFIFATPIVILLAQLFRKGVAPDRFTRFALSIYAFIVVVALGVAYARGLGGFGPARRYFEFLSLAPLASLMALCILSHGVYRINSGASTILLGVFITAFIAGMPMQIKAIDYTLKDRSVLKPAQTHITSRYLNTGNPDELYGHPFRHTPFPNIKMFQGILDEMSAADSLPSSLQPQPDMQWHPDTSKARIDSSAFIRNGVDYEEDGVVGADHLGEPAYGSFNPEMGGAQAMGKFESATVRISRSFAEISYMGTIDGPAMSLILENVENGNQYRLKADQYRSRYSARHHSDVWTRTLIKIPRGYYKIIAEDKSTEDWMAFGSPRSVGRLSYYAHQLRGYTHWVWKIALFMLLFSLRDSLRNLFLPHRETTL